MLNRTFIPPALGAGILLLVMPSPSTAQNPILQGRLAKTERSGKVLLGLLDPLSIPRSSLSPRRAPTLGEVAEAYERRLVRFGDVEALVARSMRVFRLPGPKDTALPDLGSPKAFRLLLATLDDEGWKLLQSGGGIGLGDLKDDAQRGLFLALVSNGDSIEVGVSGFRGPTRSVVGPPSSRRLRLTQRARVYFLTQWSGQETWFGPKNPGEYQMYGDAAPPRAAGGASAASDEVANDPKPSQIDLAAKPLKANVSLARLSAVTKVGDLVAKIRAATGLEIYADSRYGKLPIYADARGTVAASDLLRALLATLSATVRRVGPAYVITDDLRGTGALTSQWTRRRTTEEALRALDLLSADEAIRSRFSVAGLYRDDSPQRLTEGQLSSATADESGTGFLRVRGTLRDLTAEQQEEAAKAAKAVRRPAIDLQPESKVDLIVSPHLQIVTPNFEAPISIPGGADFLMASARPRRKKTMPEGASVAKSLARFERRTAAFDYRALPTEASRYDALKALGFDAVWIGAPVDHLLGGATLRDVAAVVMAVEAAGMRPKIVLRPTLRQGLTDARYDRTISGLGEPIPDRKPSTDVYRWVAPSPGGSLPDSGRIVAALSSIPGLHGVALRNTAPPGYLLPIGVSEDGPEDLYGYSEEMRLAFLRARSIDPIDLPVRHPVALSVDLRPPLIAEDEEGTRIAVQHWARERTAINERMVRSFVAALDRAGGERGWERTFVQQRRAPFGGEWYGEWRGTGPLPGAPPPDAPLGQTTSPTLDEFLIRGDGVRGVLLGPSDDLRTIVAWLDGAAQGPLGGVVVDFQGWPQERVSMERAVAILREKR